MTTVLSDPRPPSERINDLPHILQAIQRAVHDASLDHKRAGNPVAVWRNGQIEWIQPEDIPVDEVPPDREGP